jgi:hypothetical protein
LRSAICVLLRAERYPPVQSSAPISWARDLI